MNNKNKFLKVFWIFVLICNFFSTVNSQNGNIEGIVTTKDEIPLQYVLVEILNTNRSTYTKPDGKYKFDSIPENRYVLKFSKLRYNTTRSEDIFVENGRTTQVSRIPLQVMDSNAKLQNLPSLLDDGNLGEFKKELDFLKTTCNDIKSEDCRLVDEINTAIPTNNLNSLKIKTIQLLFNIGVIDEEVYFYEIGTAQLKNKNFNEAIENLTKSIEIERTATFSYTNRGKAYFQTGKLNKAISDYTKAIELSPLDTELLNFRSEVYFKSKFFKEAEIDISKAIKLEPNDPVFYLQRAKIFDALNLKDLAEYDRNKAELLKKNIP